MPPGQLLEDAENKLLEELAEACGVTPPPRTACLPIHDLLLVLTSYRCSEARTAQGKEALLCPAVFPLPAAPVTVLIESPGNAQPLPPGLYYIKTSSTPMTYCSPNRRLNIPRTASFRLLSPLKPAYTGIVEHALQATHPPTCGNMRAGAMLAVRDARGAPALISITILLGGGDKSAPATHALLPSGPKRLDGVRGPGGNPFASAALLFHKPRSGAYEAYHFVYAEYEDIGSLVYPVMLVYLAFQARAASAKTLSSIARKIREVVLSSRRPGDLYSGIARLTRSHIVKLAPYEEALLQRVRHVLRATGLRYNGDRLAPSDLVVHEVGEALRCVDKLKDKKSLRCPNVYLRYASLLANALNQHRDVGRTVLQKTVQLGVQLLLAR